jgi:hypothetical protein
MRAALLNLTYFIPVAAEPNFHEQKDVNHNSDDA